MATKPGFQTRRLSLTLPTGQMALLEEVAKVLKLPLGTAAGFFFSQLTTGPKSRKDLHRSLDAYFRRARRAA